MCGIVGYIGSKPVVPILLNGLRKLEYRGYDSAGLAVVSGRQVQIRRSSGKLINLARALESEGALIGEYGIGHTRWATHGRPTEENAHPHRDCSGKIVVVHNGIVENYLEIKTELQKAGHRFATETDTEIIAHLVESLLPERTFPDAVRLALARLRGSFALCIISADAHKTIIAASNGPPLAIGLGENEFFVASDIPPLLEHTRKVYFLRDGEMAILERTGVRLQDFQGRELSFAPEIVTWTPEMAEKGGYPHFMLKEIHEQPRAIEETIVGRISLDTGQIYLGAEANLSEKALS